MTVKRLNRSLRNALCLTALALPLSGCLLPPVVTIASLALDVGSYAVSGKTMTDHGISLVAEEDCALMRVFEGHLCEDYQDYEAQAVATLQPLPSGNEFPQYAEKTLRHQGDPLAALPLGYDDTVLVSYDNGGSFAEQPLVEKEQAETPLGLIQFARVPTDSFLTRDMR